MMKLMVVMLVFLGVNSFKVSILAGGVSMMMALMISKHDCEWWNLSVWGGMDTLSWGLVILSVWVVLLIIFSSLNWSSKKYRFFFMVLLLVLVSAFYQSNILMFYIWFEFSLVPLFILIMGWGAQPERVKSVMYFILYTVFASLPLMMVILFFLSKGLFYWGKMEGGSYSLFFLVAGSLAFLVKLPLYFSHLWLIKAHVEAPVGGSMVLASIMLKLGGYGIFRMGGEMIKSFMSLSWGLMSWGLVGGVSVSLLCLQSEDVKVLIALSSVGHMAMVVGGVVSFSVWGLNGAYLIMMGHGLGSSALFYLANIGYLKTGNRSFVFMKGLGQFIPMLSFWLFIFVVVSLSGPPFINLLGEIYSVLGVMNWSGLTWVILGSLAFLSGAYSLVLFMKMQHGSFSSINSFFCSLDIMEGLILVSHCAPLVMFTVKWSHMVFYL